MCVVSNMIDGFNERYRPYIQPVQPYTYPSTSKPFDPWWEKVNTTPPTDTVPQLTPEELQAFRDMLKAGKTYDEVSGQPDCESDDKIAKLRSILITYLAELNEMSGDDEVVDSMTKDLARDLVYDIAETVGLDINFEALG